MMKFINDLFLLNDKSRVSWLEGLRGFSALIVFFFHYNLFNSVLLKGGHLGVDIFFVLSGYFISKILFDSNTEPIFYLKGRIYRLMPAYLISLIIIWLIHYDILTSYKGFIANIFFIPIFFKKNTLMNFVAWTLAWEWIFYLLALMFYYLKKFVSPKLFKTIVSVVFIIILFFTILNQDDNKYYRFIGFYFGSIIYLFPIKINFKYLGIICFVNIILLILFYGKFVEHFSDKFSLPAFYIFFDFNIYLLIYYTLKNRSFVIKFFENRFLFFIGKISYSFYLVHSLLGVFLAKIFITKIGLSDFYILSYFITFIFCTLFASILYIISERPYFYFKNK